jgi:hypothetical protein
MRTLLAGALAVSVMTLGTNAAVLPVGLQAGDISVAASYKGKGPVDEKHKVLVFLFDHPNPSAGSTPLGLQTISKNGDAVTFKGVTTNPVYVTMVYDEKANYDGNSPPPVGAPIGSYSKGGKAIPVKPGDKVKATFDDSVRWK